MKNKNKSPAFRFYPADFMSDENVVVMSNQEVGLFFKNLCRESINNNVKYLNRFVFIGRLFKGGVWRKAIPKRIRAVVLSGGLCVFCGSKEKLTVDHIKPYSKGGGHEIENLQCLCWACNRKKGASYHG